MLKPPARFAERLGDETEHPSLRPAEAGGPLEAASKAAAPKAVGPSECPGPTAPEALDPTAVGRDALLKRLALAALLAGAPVALCAILGRDRWGPRIITDSPLPVIRSPARTRSRTGS